MRHKRDFTQSACSVVTGSQFFDYSRTLSRADRDRETVMKLDRDVVHERSRDCKRLRRKYNSVYAIPVRTREYLLARNVADNLNSVCGLGVSTAPSMPIDQADSKICAPVIEMQPVELLRSSGVAPRI